MKICDYFKNKKVLQMGLGLLGRGVGDAKFIAECSPKEFKITDLKSENDLEASLKELEGLNIEFVLGEHKEKDFKDADVVLKSAGVPLNSPYIKLAKENGTEVYMSSALTAKYAQELGMTVVGVTGTRGKSSTTLMIYNALKNKIKDRNIFLGGNIRGVSTLQLSKDFKEGDILVLELDSWQLQGFGDLKISPNIAVFTNFYPDHLNYYPDLDSYFKDKANIFKYQDLMRGDLLVVSDEIYEKIKKENPPVEPFEASRIPEEWKLKVPGLHMRANAALALEVLSQLGLSMSEIKEELENFEGVEGRLEYLKETSQKLGVDIYNDNNATSPDATIAAIDSLARERKENAKLLLIAGGKDKGLPLEKLAQTINEKADKVFLVKNDGTEKLKELLKVEYEEFEDLEGAVRAALCAARKGDIVLFSPAFASFSHEFKNEYERNDKFKKLIRDIVSEYAKQ